MDGHCGTHGTRRAVPNITGRNSRLSQTLNHTHRPAGSTPCRRRWYPVHATGAIARHVTPCCSGVASPNRIRTATHAEARSAALPHCDRPTGAQRHAHGNDGRRKVELPSAYTHALVWMTTSMSVMRVLRRRQRRPIRRPNSSGCGCAAAGAIATDAARARGCDATQRYGRTGGAGGVRLGGTK